jgi:hypothetical protein
MARKSMGDYMLEKGYIAPEQLEDSHRVDRREVELAPQIHDESKSARPSGVMATARAAPEASSTVSHGG